MSLSLALQRLALALYHAASLTSLLCVYRCTAPFQNGTCNSDLSTSSSVDLYWLPVESAIYYLLSYDQTVFNVSSTNLTVDELTAGYLYTFYLQSFGPGGSSNKSNCSYSTCKSIFSVKNIDR